MAHSWEVKERNNVNIKIPAGFKSYTVGPILIFKLINSEKGKYKDSEEVANVVTNLIIEAELKKLKIALRKINKKYFKGFDKVFYKNQVKSLIKKFENNTFEILTFEIHKMLHEQNNSSMLNNYELLIDSVVNGFRNFWTHEYPELEKYETIYRNFKRDTLNSLEEFETSIKSYKKYLKNIDRNIFKQLDEALLHYEIELNPSSIIKKNHTFKKLISDDNLLEENYKNISKFESWLNIRILLAQAIETTIKKAEAERIAQEKAKADAKAEADRVNKEKININKKYRELNNQYEKYKSYVQIIDNDYSKEIENFLFDLKDRFIKLNTSEILSLKPELDTFFNKLQTYIHKINEPEETINLFLESKNINFLIVRGKAGVGKTTLIKQIIKTYYSGNTLLPLFKDLINSKEIVVTAPTRVACANIRQRKIWHSRTIQHIVNEFEKNPYYRVNSDLNKIKLLIIDESSMVGELLFKRINNIFAKNISNGQLKIVFIGDEAQLTPINENVSPTLSKKRLESAYNVNNGYKGLELDLNIDFRLSSNFNSEYISFLEDLRNSNIDHKNIIKDMTSRLLASNSVGVVEEDNQVVSFFNKWVDIGIYVKERLDNEESFDDILYSLNKRENFQNNLFSTSDVFAAFELYKNQINQRPKLVELYSKFYPDVEKRIENPKNLNTIMSLFRTNEQAAHVNVNIRNYLFNHKLKENEYICKGEVLKVELTAFDESLYNDERLYRGDTFVVVSEPNLVSDNFYEIKLCQINQNISNPITFFLDKYLNITKTIRAVVWTGGLKYSVDSNGKYLENKKLKKLFLENIKNSKTSLDENTLKKINNSYCVSYDYAKVTFASQGGEWDNIIIQSGDVWTNVKDSHRYLYTAFTRARKKVYLYS